jgi:hypothetical protein
MLRWGGICAGLAALCLLVSGCGADEGVASGATATVYAAAPLCAGAERESARNDDRAGDVRVRLVCLEAAERRGGLDLAVIGANARRATEDSTSVGYIGEPTKAATRFSAPILEAAEIAQLPQSSGEAAMAKLLKAVRQAAGDSGALRQSVYGELH